MSATDLTVGAYMSGVYPTPPMTPRPPALETAAASFGPAATFIPARRTGWLIFSRSVVTVRSCSVLRSVYARKDCSAACCDACVDHRCM